MTSTQKLLQELIALPSVNSSFLPLNHPRAGEHRVAEFLAARARKEGLDIQWQRVFPNRANLLVRLKPRGRIKQRILLAPHLDTVDVTSEAQLKPRVKDGRLFGRGACDTKGSVAAMLAALFEVARGGRRPQATEIIFAGLVDEEMGQAGSRALAASGLRANLAIVGEPTRLRVVTCHKGDLWLKLETHGKSAHGSRPELGRNAVREMAQIVTWLETKYAAHLHRRRHSLLGHGTVNVGTITGGTQANIVPDHCEITIDRRTLPGESEAGVVAELRTLLKHAGLQAIVASAKGAPCEPMETDPSLPLVRHFLKAARQPKPEGVSFYCDAAVLSEAGIPSVVFGPGDIAQGHTADEWISLASLERSRRILVNYLQALP